MGTEIEKGAGGVLVEPFWDVDPLEADLFFAAADADGDGQVSEAEALSAVCLATGDDKICDVVWGMAFWKDAKGFVQNIPLGVADMMNAAAENGARRSSHLPPGIFKNFISTTWSLSSIITQTALGIFESGRLALGLVAKNWDNPEQSACARTFFAGLAFAASFVPLLRSAKIPIPTPKSPPLAEALAGAGAGVRAGEGAAVTTVSVPLPPAPLFFRDAEEEGTSARRTESHAPNLAETKARVTQLIRRRREVLDANPGLREALAESRGEVTAEITRRFGDDIQEVVRLSQELKDLRARHNRQMLQSKEAHSATAGESINDYTGSGGIAFSGWVDVETGLLERFGNPQKIFPMKPGSNSPAIPPHLDGVTFRIEMETGKITHVLSDAPFAGARLEHLVGEKFTVGMREWRQIISRRIQGRTFQTKGGWEVLEADEIGSEQRLVAIRGNDSVELGPVVKALDYYVTGIVKRNIVLDGKFVGHIAYRLDSRELVITYIAVVTSREGIGGAVIAHLIEAARASGRRLSIGRIMNAEGIIGLLKKEGYDGFAIDPFSGAPIPLSEFDLKKINFAHSVIIE